MGQIIQYYYRQGLFSSQVLWVQTQCRRPDIDQLGYAGPKCEYTVDRRATPAEAAAVLPILNAGLKTKRSDNQGVTVLPDGSAFSVISMPLPKGHWLHGDPEKEDEHGFEAPPMRLRMGRSSPVRQHLTEIITEAAKYALRAASMKGVESDLDPDAVIQNLVVGLFGYHTEDGFGTEEWENSNAPAIPEAQDASPFMPGRRYAFKDPDQSEPCVVLCADPEDDDTIIVRQADGNILQVAKGELDPHKKGVHSNMPDYIGAKIETPWRIGVVDRREDGRYMVKWTNRKTGRTREDPWRQEDLDHVAEGKSLFSTLTMAVE